MNLFFRYFLFFIGYVMNCQYLDGKFSSLIFLQVDELQNTIEEDQKSLVEEMRLATEELKNGMEDASGGSDAMAVDH